MGEREWMGKRVRKRVQLEERAHVEWSAPGGERVPRQGEGMEERERLCV